MPTLEWIGKDKVINHHQEVPFRVLDRKYSFDENGQRESDNNSENKIIRGDNLEALKALLPQYEGKIKCIYIDPPYNTGNEGWVYNDNVNHPKIKKWLGDVVGKEGEDLSRHDKWLCMMYPRLKLLHKLLVKDGAIFISIDINEKFNLKLLCDEIFGGNNFIADISVINNLKGRSDDKYIATAHESLLIFQKGEFITNGVALPEVYEDEYKLLDENGKYRLLGLRKRGSNAREIDRPNLFYPIYYCPKTLKISIEEFIDSIEILPKLSSGENGTWRWGKNTLLERLDELQVNMVKGRNEYDVFQKDYLPDDGSKRIKPKSFWMGSEFAAETGTLQMKKLMGKGIFETPKPTGIVEYCIEQSTDKNSIVLDSFAGSGTTAHAVLNKNKADGGSRKFILVEMEDYAETITAERVKRVINGYVDIEGTGGNFSFYDLGEPLLIDNQCINENISKDKIREYIYFMETKLPLEKCTTDNKYYLGKNNDNSYYFYYEKERITTLTHDFLATVKTKSDGYIIYADKNALSDEELTRLGIVFKKIPRDIARL